MACVHSLPNELQSCLTHHDAIISQCCCHTTLHLWQAQHQYILVYGGTQQADSFGTRGGRKRLQAGRVEHRMQAEAISLWVQHSGYSVDMGLNRLPYETNAKK